MGLFDDLLEEEGLLQRPTTKQPRKRKSGLFDDLLEEEGLLGATPTPTPKPAPQRRRLPWEDAPKPVGLFEGISNSARNAFASSQQALSVTGGVTPEEAQEISKIEYEKNARQASPDYKAYQEAEGWDAVNAFINNPVEVTTNIVAEGLAGSLPSLGAGLAVGGVGAAAGSVVPGVGTGAGFIAGQVAGTFAGSLATEYGSKVLEELQNEGMNLSDPNSITEFFSNQKLVDAAKDKALKRGVPIAAFDAVSAGLGGKVGKILGTAFKTKTREATAELAIQAGLGGGGEVVGSLVAGDEIDPKAVFSEVVGELGPGSAEIAIGKAQQVLSDRRKQRQVKQAAETAEKLENSDAPLTADALKTTVAKNIVEQEKQTADKLDEDLAGEVEKVSGMRPIREEEEFVMPPKEEFKASYAKLTPESLAETEASFQEQLQDEDADTRAFAQTALEALAEFKAEQTPVPPTPVRKAELPTDALPIETPAATYGREEGVYDVFADVRRQPLPPSGPAFESAQVIEQELARAETLRQSPEGRAQLRRELQGEQMTGEVRRAVEQALATTPEVAEEGDVFAVSPVSPTTAEPTPTAVEPTPVTPVEAETAASLSRVADNTATDEEVVRLARQGLVNIQDGQNVITPRGEEVIQRAGAPLPRLTPRERAAEIAAPAEPIISEKPATSYIVGAEPVAIVEQEPVAPAITEQEVDSEIAKTNREIASLESQRKAEALKDSPRKQVVYGFDDRIKESKERLKALNKQKDAFYYGKIQEQEVGLEDALQAEADKIAPRDTTGPLSQAETITLNGLRLDEEMSGKLSRISQIAKDRLEARAAAPTPVTTPPVTEAVTPEVAPANPPKVNEVIAVDRKNNTEFALVKGLLPERPDMFSIGIRLIGSTQPFESGGYGHNTNKDRIMQRFFEKERTRLQDIEVKNQYFKNILSEEEAKVSEIETQKAADKIAQEEQQRVFNEQKSSYEEAISKVKLPTGKSETMRFTAPDGSEQALDSTRYGNIGIRKVTSGKKPLYNVDHWHSGLRITQVASLSEAKKLAQAIIASGADISSKDIKESELEKMRPVVRYFLRGESVPQLPTPAVSEAPAAEPAGISVGSKIQLKGNTFNKYVVTEVLPQTDFEVRNNERSYILKNEKTGEVMPRPFTEQDFDKVDGKKFLKMAPVRVEEKVQPVPEAERYTLEEAGIRAIEFFGGVAPDGLLIVNDSVDPDYRMKAGYDPETGQIILNRAFIRKGDSIEDILTHELGHYIFSDPKFQADFKNFLDSMPDNTRAQIEAIINQSYNRDTNQTQIEERQVMAFTALVKASKQSLSAWENLKNTIKRWINRVLRTNIKLSDEGAMAVFNVGYKRFKRGDQIVRAMEEGVLRMAPESEAAPAEKPARRTKMQNIIDISTGVRRPRTKLTVDEMAALKDQIRIGARKRREDKQTQKEFAKDVTEYLRGMAIRGKVSAPQLRAVTSKAMQTQFDNEASIKSFINYANKVIENANYNRDISDAKAAIKTANKKARQKEGSSRIKAKLQELASFNPNDIEPEDMSPRQAEVDGEIITETPVSVAEYTAVLKEYMASLGPVTAEGFRVIPEAEIIDFTNKVRSQVASNADARNKAAFAEKLQKALDNKAMLPSELDAITQTETAEQYEEHLKRKGEEREKIEKAITELAMDTQSNLVTYDDSNLNADELQLVNFLRALNIADMRIGDRKNFVMVANNIIVNNDFSGAQKFEYITRGQLGAAQAAKDSQKVKRGRAMVRGPYAIFDLISGNLGTDISIGMQSLADTVRNITSSDKLASLLYQMGFGEIETGRAKSMQEREKIANAVQVRLDKIQEKNKQQLNDPGAMTTAGIAATLIQTTNDETEAEGIQRMRGLVQKDIEKKRGSWKPEDRKEAIRGEKALKDLNADSVEGILAQLEKLYPANYETLMFFMNDLLPAYKESFKKHDEMFNNQTDNYDNPYYLPIKYRTITTEIKDPGDGVGNQMIGVSSPKQSKNSIKRVKNTVLPENMTFDYNLVRNVMDSLSGQLDAMYMNPGLQQLSSFLKSENAIAGLGSAENLEVMKRRANMLANARERHSYDMTPSSRLFDSIANFVRKIGSSLTLGGFTQAFKQMPDQMITTFVNVGDGSITLPSLLETREARDAMMQFSIGMRGEIAGGAKWINQLDNDYANLEKYFKEGLLAKVGPNFDKINDAWLFSLKFSDSFAAAHGWISYYKQYLKKNGIPFTNWDNETKLIASRDESRVKAGLYADNQVDTYQGSSDPTKMAQFAQRGRSGGENLLKTMILPFSSFVIQQRARILTDLRNIIYGNAEERAIGARGLTGTIFGIIAFHSMRRYWLPIGLGFLTSQLYGLLGIDMDEPDEEEEQKKMERVFKQFISEIATNITIGGYSAFAEAQLIDKVNLVAYAYDKLNQTDNIYNEEGKELSWEKYRETNAPLYRYTGPGADSSLGMVGIIPEQLGSMLDKLKDIGDEELMDSLTDEEQNLLVLAAFSETLLTFRLNDTDVARLINRMTKEVKDQAKEREKSQRKLMRDLGIK